MIVCDIFLQFTSGRTRTDTLDITFGEVCFSRTHSPRGLVAFFSHHVVDIFFLCTQKQVIWIYTPPIITTVTNNMPLGNRAAVQLPRNTVS